MALNRVLRSSLIQMRVLDFDKTVDFYTRVLGLNEVSRSDDDRIFLKAYDEFDHHSVVLRLADTAGIDFIGFKVDTEENLEKIKVDTEKFGYPVTEIPANTDQPGFGKRYSFTISTGHRFDVYCDVELAKEHPEIINPNIWSEEPRGMRAQRFDHALLYGPNIEEAERFCKEVFGMYIPEIVNQDDGSRLATWITGNNTPHDLAFVEYHESNKIHHLGFYLEDWNAIGNAADLMAINHLKRDIGPTRHAITRGQTIYFWEPSGNRIEVYSGGYTASPDQPQRVWDMEHLGRGLFYYEGEMIPSFLEVVT